MQKPAAEDAYLFRHALMRDAAYELQTPSDRGGLHALALAIIEDLCGGAPMPDQRPWIDSFQPHASDSYALELATHAELAGEAAQRKAALYLLRAAQLEGAGYRMFSALALYRRLAELPGADDYQRAVAHMDAGQVHYRLGELEQAARAYDAAAAWIDPARDPAGAMQLKTCRTIVESHTDNGPQVAQAHLEAAEYWKEHGDLRKRLLSMVNFAIWHCEKGDHEVARGTLRDAIGLARAHGYKRAEDAAVGTLAMLDTIDGRYAEAETGLLQAIAIARDTHNLPAELSWNCSLANLQRKTGQLEAAERLYRHVVSTAAANGLDARRDFAEAFLAATLMQAGRREEAEPLWAKAWSAAIARGDAYNLSTLRGGMNSALEKAGLPPLEQDGSLPV